jgi:hypothetical protein
MTPATQTRRETSNQQNGARWHRYHAEAHVLSGFLKHPIDQPIRKHAEVVLKTRRSEHVTETIRETNLEGLISFRSGHSRVSGSKVVKKETWDIDHSGWVTLSTSVLEGLNIFEVITADRIVSQVSTEHALERGHVPQVTFLGTQFNNLQVSGFPLALTWKFGICGNKPPDGRSYLADHDFLNQVEAQTREINDLIGKHKNLPKDLRDEYASRHKAVKELIEDCRAHREPRNHKVTCSLVQSIGEIPIPGILRFGNVLVIPNFGWLALAEVEVGTESPQDAPYREAGNGNSSQETFSNYFDLEMLDIRLGCVGGGNVVAGQSKSNGTTYP